MKRGGSFMPKDVREDVGSDPEYSRCALQGLLLNLIGPCGGRPTREHALIHAGKKIQEKWAIPPICAAHHGVDQYQDAPTEAKKEIRVWVALNRATEDDLRRFSKAVNYIRMRQVLNDKYGEYVAPLIPDVMSNAIAPQIFRKARTPVEKLDETEREIRKYARTNECTLEEARETLEALCL